MPIDKEQFNIIRQAADEAILNYAERKEALELLRKLQKVLIPSQVPDTQLLAEGQKIIAQLKWVACPLIKENEEFFDLVKYNFLEGLEMDYLVEIVLTRFAFQFGAGTQETLNGLMLSLRENVQLIGSQPIMVKGETRPVRPAIRNWLIDFLRNIKSENPNEIEEANYIFSNPNPKTLSEEDRKKLGKLLSFYDIFRSFAKQLAFERWQGQIIPTVLPKAEPDEFEKQERQTGPPVPPRQTAGLGIAAPRTSYPDRPSPPAPASFSPRPQTLSPDTYRETVKEEDITSPPITPKPEPKIDGNIVDLKNINNR